MGIRRNKLSANLMAIVLTILLLPMAAYGLPGDLNGSGRVDGFDLIMFGRANGSVATDDAWNPDADMNRDGTVDNKDLDILSAHFGKNGISFGLWVGSETGTEKVFKLSSTGNILQKVGAFNKPASISGDIHDNTVWVADSNEDKVIKLSGFDGTQILSVSGIDPYSVSTDLRDGSVWVADYTNNRVIKLLPSVTDGYDVGTDTGSHIVISGFSNPRWVSVNSDTGEIWVADTRNNSVVRLSQDVPDGYDIQTDIGRHSTKSGFSSPYCVSVNSADGTAWVADYGNHQVVKLSATATTEIVRVSGFNQPLSLDTSTTDGSVWVADYNNDQVVRLSADGSLICRVGGFSDPYSVGVNPLDGSAWVADYSNDQVVRLSPNGTELMRISGMTRPMTISVISDEVSDTRYPSATAILNLKTATSGETITFTGTGNDPDGTIALYEWDFDGDGNVDFSSTTTGVTTHAYTAEGLYNPIFRVTDNDWLTATDYSQIVRIGVLKALADSDVTSGNAPLKVIFTGEFVDPIDGFVDSFQWDFDGDNIFDHFSETSPETTYTYLEPGHYVATFKVTDGSYTATDHISIDVDVSSPTATVNASPDAGAAPLKVSFSGSGTDPDGLVMLYEWDFEDDGTYDWFSISNPNTSFVYNNDGSYTARLRVTDNDGLTGTQTASIEVGTTMVPLAVVANADKTSGRAPLTVNFNAIGSSTEMITKYEWNFGDCSLFSDSMDIVSNNFQADSPWGLVQSDFHSKKSSWTDSPGGDYSENTDQSLTTIALDLSAVSTATLSFWHRYETERYYDYCRVEISIDGEKNWSQLNYFYGSQDQWTEVTTDISSYLPNADVRIRFRFTSNDSTNYDGWYIDDVRICSVESDWNDTSDGSISHTYNQSGQFAATLRITDNADNQKTDTVNIDIDPAAFPEATADADPKTGETPLTVTFTATASDADGTIAAYDWNFGEEYVWIADSSNDQVVRVCQDGSCELVRNGGFNDPYSVSINPNDGTVWVADYYNHEVVRLSANGKTELVRVGGFRYPVSVSVNPTDGTVWVADYSHNQVVKLSSDGTELVRVDGYSRPYCVSVNPTDGSVWVADYGNNQVVKLASDGTGLARISGFSSPFSLAVNSADGTIWVANTGSDTVTRLASDIRDGYHIGQDTESHLVIEGFNDPYSLAVNLTDNTVWVADYYNHQVVHLASDGSELLRLNGFHYPTGVAVNSSTSAVWVADYSHNQIVKLSPDGKELARLDGYNRPRSVAVSDTGSQNYYNSSTSGNTTHAYTVPGIYHAVFTATDNNNNVISKSVDLAVLSSPDVVASSNISNGSAPLEVFLTAKVTELSGTVTQYEWDFDGDGTYDAISEISPNALHVYPTAGTYTSTLRVTTDLGYSNTDSVTITITPTPPQAQALAVPVEGNVPLAVTFNGSGIDVDGTIVKYEWDFENDGSIDFTSPTTGETTHTYATANTYTAALKVTDNDGLTAIDHVNIIVKASTDPSAFIYNPDSQVFSTHGVQFYVHGIDPNGTIATYEIDFDGDGTFETIQPTAFGDNMENNPNYWAPGESWARVATDSHSPSYCWTDSPATNYPDSADTSLTSSTIDLSTAIAPKLIFWHKYSFQYSDYGRIEVSGNDGVSWTQIKYFSNATLTQWGREEIDLSSYAGNATVKIRFRLTSNTADTADGWYIDDVWAGDFIEHTYAAHGNYIVALRVTDNEGNSTVTTQTISIVASENTTNVWVADYANNRVVKLSDMGDILVKVNGFNRPRVVEANPVTGDVWVSDTYNDRVVKLSKDVPDGYNVSDSYATDVSAISNPGVIYGNTTVSETGQFNKGLYFDGSGDYVQIPDAPVYRTNSWTLEAWVQPDNLVGNRTIVGKVSQGKDLALMMTGDKISAMVYDGGRQYLTTTDPVTIGEWYHVAASYDSSTGKLRFYVDGVFIAEKAVTPDTSNTDPLMIGRSNCCSEYFFGTIDDVRVWNVARTQSEISTASQSELTGSETGLVGYWKLDAIETPHHQVVTGFNDPWGLSVNTSDNSVWVADRNHYQVVKLASNGTEIKRINGFYKPSDIVVNSGDGTVWVSDTSNNRIVKLASDVPDGFIASASGITQDDTSSQNFGMLIGDVSIDLGNLSSSLWFDGSGDYLVISPDSALDVQNFTLEAWIKGSYITNRALFMRGNASGGNELYFGFDNATTLQAIIDNGDSAYFSGEVDFTDGEWHHVALVYDSAQISCYVDGAAYGDPITIAAILDFGNSQALIGADFDSFNGGLGNYYKGHIDDVRLWNVARTEAEINAGKDAGISSGSPGLVGYWTLDVVSDSYSQISTGFDDPYGLSLDLSDNGVWVADFYNNQVVKLASDGSQMYRQGGYNRPYSLSVNPNDRTVWVADHENDRLVKLRPDGMGTEWVTGFNNPHDVEVNPDDSTVWVADYLHDQVVKLAPDGTELLRISGFNDPLSLSIDPAKRNLVQPPSAIATATPTSGSVSLEVTFTGSGNDNGSIDNYSWDFDGDGIYDYTSATTGNTTHAYNKPGTYSPMFRVTDDSGLMVYAAPGIIYAGPMTVLPSASPQSGDAPLNVTLDGHVLGLAKDITIAYYEWDYDGDGVFDYKSQAEPGSSYTYSPGGKYNAILRVTDTLGNQAYASLSILVTKQPPTVSNSATPTTGNAPLSVSLNGSGSDKDGSIIRYEWDYDGDGTYDWFSTSESNAYFTYKTAGTYDAVIRVTDNDGLTATAIKTITVTEKQNPPMANADASITKGPVPLTVTFTGTGTDVDGQIQLYEWDFDGDGTYDYSSADLGNTSHTYSSPGLFHPLFRVTDVDGLTATADLLIIVQDTGAPIANANASPKTGATPLTVSFDGIGSSDPGGNIVRYDWSFGNDVAWVADYGIHKVHRLNEYQIDKTLEGFYNPYRLSINLDGTLWLSDHSNNQIVKLSADGKGELSRTDGFNRPYGVSTDPADGGVWVADYGNHQVAKLDTNGTETLRVEGFYYPTSVAVYSGDRSVWVTDYYHNQVVKLDSDGNQLARINGFNRPFWVSVNQEDGSAWIADRNNNRVIKLSGNTPSGYNTAVQSVTPEVISGAPAMLFGNPAAATGVLSGGLTLNGSGDYVLISEDTLPNVENFTIEAWVKGSYVNGQAIFMRGNASGGNEIYFGFYNNTTINAIVADSSTQRFSGSVNFTDGNWHHVALTYDAAGQTLSCYVDGSDYGTPVSVSADLDFEGSHALIGADFDSFNGSPGNYFTGQIDDVRMWNVSRTSAEITAAKDQELTGSEVGLVGYWKLDTVQDTPYHKMLTGFNEPVHIAISPLDGSAWVCDYQNNQMVRISPDCTNEIARVDGFYQPHEAVVSSLDGNVWVADHYNNQIVVLTNTGREIRRISGFNRPTSVVLAPRSENLTTLTADQIVTHTYPQIGEYIASLTVTDNDGNMDTDTIAINAGTYPEAIAIAYPTSGTAPLKVRFAANGYSPTRTIEYFSWDFDGNGSTDWTTRISENKEYTYNQPGIYRASLTVTDNKGFTDVKQVTITVQASDDAPFVSASADPAEGNAPLDVMLTGLAKDSDGTIVKHEWDFDGNGIYDYTSTVSGITSHIYTELGVYNAKLRVTDNDGNQGTDTSRIEVKADNAPTAKAMASVTHGAAALEIQFTGSGSEGDTIVKYEWDFDGNGTFDISATDTGNISHTYTIPGSFNAVLRVTDALGLTDTASINILVSAGITASLSQDSFDPTADETIDINSVLTATAVVTVLVTDRTGNIIRKLVKDESRSPGYYSDTWDGKDESGQVLESGAYLYVIKYETGGQTYIYDLTNNISLDIAKITPIYPTTFNPLNADTNFFRYELDTKSEVTVYISPFRGGAMDRIKTLLLRQPQKAGSYVLTWDGTDDSGNLVAAESYVLAVFRWYLPENAIIINTRPIISDPLINPAYLNPDALPYSDENQAIMSYTLSKKADVSLTIYDSFNYIVKSIIRKDVLAGPGNLIKWDGKNTDGENVTPGIYRTKLIATDANGNKSHDANALLIIFY